MTKTLFAILLAGAATCAVAAPANDQPRHTRARTAQAQERVRTEPRTVNRRATQRTEQRRQVVQNRAENRQVVRNRIENRQVQRPARPVVRHAPTRPIVRPTRTHPPVISRQPRPATQPPVPTTVRPGPRPHWNDSWRHNHKYDFNDWRRLHRALFHLGFYTNPFGWQYQRYYTGWRLWPRFYESRYWINDPWQYRLPPPPPGCRWIRYYNDALLVDMWSGEVVDVVYDFFW